ncbi:arginine--tRNA ligase [Candidatus Saccharibacteria bacterium]|nr:arginine--tRNA ligase [Candidatus Saccharibacteria bacterium]
MEDIRKQIEMVVKDLFGVDVQVVLSVVPEGVEGDYACNVAMQLAKQVGKPPREIAEEIISGLSRKQTGSLLSSQGDALSSSQVSSHFANVPQKPINDFSVSVAGAGFLNFTLSDEMLRGELEGFEVGGASEKYAGKVVVTEFSDPNPFKVLHVGHLYTSIVGDGLSRLIEYAGGEVHRTNFGGDVGLHVAKTIYEILRRGDLESFDAKSVGEKMEYIAECYVAGTRAYEGDDEAVRSEIYDLNKKIYEIAEKNERDGDAAKIYWAGREASYEYFDGFYERIGLQFEKYYPESTVAELGLKTVREHVGEVYEESDGAVIYRGEKGGLHTRVFINKEGLPTYEAKDVGLIEQKWRDYEFDESIVITAAEQKDYMKVVLASVAEFAPQLVERTRHLTHGMVKLPGAVKMSSRKGNFLRAVDVIDMVEGEGVESVVALGAIKYAFLKVKMEGDIAFDAKESVNMQGNSGPYLQYALVRAKSILRQEAGELKEETGELGVWERRLLLKILDWRGAMVEAVEELAPHKVCLYLYELAQEFSRFYENNKVVDGENEALRRRLVGQYAEVLAAGLNLLGIEAPEKM